jgi:OPA family sugar phosphate sensor protein UhpC-like MFS transporter
MAFWATCYQVGGLAAGLLCAELLGAFGWRSTFFVPALWVALVALLVFMLLRPGPGAGAGSGESQRGPPSAETIGERKRAQLAVVTSGVLWSFGASYFFIKFIRYTILFWLPYYLATALSYDQVVAARVSNAFEVGGIVGVIGFGTLSDRLRQVSRPLLSALLLLGLALALVLYVTASTAGTWANALALALVGAMLFAPDSLLSGAAAQDAGGPHAAAMATGFVNGVGSVGGMISGVAVSQLSKHLGWSALVPVLVALAVCAALALLPALVLGRRAHMAR